MIPAMSVMLSISNPRHPLYHGECVCCQEHYDKPFPEITISSNEEARRAIQESKRLIALPRLREIRKTDYTSIQRLSKLSGIDACHISHLERGDHMAREDTALRLADALYVTVADLEGTAS